MAKSRKKPGCLCPIITIAMAHPVARSDHHSPLRTHKKNLADRVRLSHCIPTPFQSRQIGRGAHRRNPPVLSFHSTSFEVSCGPDAFRQAPPPRLSRSTAAAIVRPRMMRCKTAVTLVIQRPHTSTVCPRAPPLPPTARRRPGAHSTAAAARAGWPCAAFRDSFR